MSLEAAIFDLDGTMAETEELHRRAFNAAFIKLQIGWSWGPLLYSELLEVSTGVERLHHYIESLKTSHQEKAQLHNWVPAIHSSKSEIYQELVRSGRPPLRPGVKRLIGEARRDGIRIAVVSTTATQNALALLGDHFAEPWRTGIDLVVGVDEVPHRKPAPDIYRRAISLLRMQADACVAFEDSSNGLRAAKTAGLTTVVTPSRWTMAQDFTGADLLIPSLGDPAAPLPDLCASAIDASMLGLTQLRRLHEGALGRRNIARTGSP